jgi:glycosyltransferase 2 family protein
MASSSLSRHSRKHTGQWRILPRRIVMPILALAIVCLACFLLYRTLSNYSLGEIEAALHSIPLKRIGLMILFAAASYLCLTGFDWLALRYVGREIPYPKVALASFCSLSLGHNIGFAALSSGAVRYRFYTRWGASAGDVAKIIVFCGMTVGWGLAVLGGGAILLRSELAARITGLPKGTLILLGAALLTLAALYIALSAWRQKPVQLWKWRIEIPSLRLALAQIVIGPINFAFVAACLHQALAAVQDVSYLEVAAVYVLANVTSLISHVPGGLGVIEAVVLYLLPGANVIGALIAFRAVYFLLPLTIGAPLFAITELMLKHSKMGAKDKR